MTANIHMTHLNYTDPDTRQVYQVGLIHIPFIPPIGLNCNFTALNYESHMYEHIGCFRIENAYADIFGTVGHISAEFTDLDNTGSCKVILDVIPVDDLAKQHIANVIAVWGGGKEDADIEVRS